MSSLKKAVVATTLLTTALLSPVSALAIVPDYSSNINSIVNFLEANQAVDGSITGFGGETAWAVMGLASNGIDPHTVQNSGVSLIDFLQNNPPSTTTGWERDLLAITAAGENPFTFGGLNYVAQIQLAANTGQIGSTTGINDDFFGILALISAGPSANQQIISDSVDFVIANQNSDGGWSYAVGNTSDNGDTAIALQALKAAEGKGFSNAGLGSAITVGLAYLQANQNPDGGWGYAGLGFSDAGSAAWSVLPFLGNDSVVGSALDFIVTKQDTSGGVDGGFGVDTYTSANSLIAFGQNNFPVSEFEGTFEEPEPQPVPPPTDDNQNQNNQNTSPGQVLAANSSSSSQNGQVLAALPNTGVNSDFVPTKVTSREITRQGVNILLLFGMGLVEVGLVLRLLSGRISKSVVS